MRKSAIAALVAMFTIGAVPSLHAADQSEWRTYMEAVAAGVSAGASVAVGELLPPGVGDVASALSASPDIVKTGLIQWLHVKMQRAVIDDDMNRLDRYQAFLTCLTNDDCTRVRAITSVSGGATGPENGTNTNGTNTNGTNTNNECKKGKKGDICYSNNDACCSNQCTDCLKNPSRCYCR